jgi:hypothetical protein
MKNPSSPQVFVALCGTLAPLLLTACNQSSWPEHEPTVIENTGADSVKVWPPGVRHALPGDVVFARVHGLRRVYVCARVLEFEGLSLDSAGASYLTPRARIESPGLPDCALSKGLDTVFEATAPVAGKRTYLRTPAGLVTDSLLSITGFATMEGFLHLPGDTLSVSGRYSFRDSTAGHPTRVLVADSMAICEFVQGTTWRRSQVGDTLIIGIRTIQAAPIDTSLLPACAGQHADTVTAVEDVHGYIHKPPAAVAVRR